MWGPRVRSTHDSHLHSVIKLGFDLEQEDSGRCRPLKALVNLKVPDWVTYINNNFYYAKYDQAEVNGCSLYRKHGGRVNAALIGLVKAWDGQLGYHPAPDTGL